MSFGRVLIVVGLLLAAAGVFITLAGRLPVRLGRLPGDIYYHRRNYTIYFPVVTCLALSVLISLVLWILRK
jgi:hypothetical protein